MQFNKYTHTYTQAHKRNPLVWGRTGRRRDKNVSRHLTGEHPALFRASYEVELFRMVICHFSESWARKRNNEESGGPDQSLTLDILAHRHLFSFIQIRWRFLRGGDFLGAVGDDLAEARWRTSVAPHPGCFHHRGDHHRSCYPGGEARRIEVPEVFGGILGRWGGGQRDPDQTDGQVSPYNLEGCFGLSV